MSEISAGSGPIRLRPPALGLLGIGLLLMIAGILTRAPTLLFAGLPLLAAPVAALASIPSGSGPLHLEWVAEGSGPEITIVGRLTGAGPLSGVEPRFDPPAPIEEIGAPELRVEGRTLRFRLIWRAPHPLIATVPVPAVSFGDPLGLAERPVEVIGAPLAVSRFPPEASRLGAIPLRRTTAIPGESVSPAIGAAGEFFGVRYAVTGDPPRTVNASASARTGRTCVNEFELERTGDLVVVLDARPTQLGPADDEALLAIGRAAAQGIAIGFLEGKNRVGLAVFGEHLDVVPLGSGRLHRHRIERLLAASARSEIAGPPERLAVALRRAFPPGVPLLVISPLADDEAVRVLPHLRRRGLSASVLSPSPLPLLAARLGSAPEDRMILRMIRLVRRVQVARAWREAPTLDWEEYWSLAGLRGLLKTPGRSGGMR